MEQATPTEKPLTQIAGDAKKLNGERKIFNVKSIKEMTYEIIDLGEDYSSLIGIPEAKFNGMAYGASGCGKTTFMLKFAANWANKLNTKVLYASYEERLNKTVQDRINNLNICASKLYFGRDLSFEELKKKIKSNHYHLVIIDSVQYAEFTVEQLHELRMAFKKRKIAFFFVSFGTSKGKTDGAKDLLHASDVKLYFHNGKVLSHGRYIEQQIEKVLFTPLKQEAEEAAE